MTFQEWLSEFCRLDEEPDGLDPLGPAAEDDIIHRTRVRDKKRAAGLWIMSALIFGTLLAYTSVGAFGQSRSDLAQAVRDIDHCDAAIKVEDYSSAQFSCQQAAEDHINLADQVDAGDQHDSYEIVEALALGELAAAYRGFGNESRGQRFVTRAIRLLIPIENGAHHSHGASKLASKVHEQIAEAFGAARNKK
jgi:hypothetical protein